MPCQRRGPGGRRQEEENNGDSDKVFSDIDSDVSDIGEEEKWKEEKSSDIEEEERSDL